MKEKEITIEINREENEKTLKILKLASFAFVIVYFAGLFTIGAFIVKMSDRLFSFPYTPELINKDFLGGYWIGYALMISTYLVYRFFIKRYGERTVLIFDAKERKGILIKFKSVLSGVAFVFLMIFLVFISIIFISLLIEPQEIKRTIFHPIDNLWKITTYFTLFFLAYFAFIAIRTYRKNPPISLDEEDIEGLEEGRVRVKLK
jgi:hypothetical protein